MHFFKTKFLKLALMSIVLAFFVVVASQLNIFSVKTAQAFNASSLDNIGLASTTSSSFTKSGGSYKIFTNQVTGLGAGQNLILSNGALLEVELGAELIMAPGTQIILDSAGIKGSIVMKTVGETNKGIRHGYLCAPDGDSDGYVNSNMTGFTKVLSEIILTTPCPAGYTEKSWLKPLDQVDCNDASNSPTNICCTTGYRDYDKDGYGLATDVSACYAPNAAYNVVANNYDCNDSVSGITFNNTDYSTCGTGSCAGSGSNACTNGVHTITTCVVSSKLCCDAAGTPKPNGTVISSCSNCNGTAADPVALADTTICNYGSYSTYTGASGACFLTSGRPIYKCSAGTCSGTSSGTDWQANQNANAIGNIWNGSAWTVATCGLNTGYGATGYFCSTSGWNSTAQRLAYGCNTGGGLDTTTPKATCNQTTCSVKQENNTSCSGGNCVTTNTCTDGIDNDGDTLIDAVDSGCGGGGQCTPGSCCDANGFYLASGTVCSTDAWSGWGGTAGACTASKTQGVHTCNTTGTCSVSATGTNYNYQYAPTAGNVWNGSAWIAASCATNTGLSGYLCSGVTQIYRNAYGCYTNGSADLSTARATCYGTTCSGAENTMCVAGNSGCQNMCTVGVDNNGNGYNDAQDLACGGYSQCTSGVCCNPANGAFLTGGTVCSSGSCTIGAWTTGVNLCTYSYTNQVCSGASSTCSGGAAASGASCYCPNGQVWQGSQCANPNTSTYCGLASSYTCSVSVNTQRYQNTLACNGSGTCNVVAGTYRDPENCPGYNPYCAGGSCVQCLSASNCGTNQYYCSGNQAYYRTYACSSNSCTYFDSTTSYCNSGGTQMCSGGSCVNFCPAGTIGTYGYVYGNIPYGAYSGYVYSGPCYWRDKVGGSWPNDDTFTGSIYCNNGTAVISSQSFGCDPGYHYAEGDWYQANKGCYNVCLSNCVASSLNGYSYNALEGSGTYSTQAVSKSSTSFVCAATASCFDGSVTIIDEMCGCRPGYYGGGTSCSPCPVGSYCPGGSGVGSGPFACPSGTTSFGPASNITDCYCPADSAKGYSWNNVYYKGVMTLPKNSAPGTCQAQRNCDPDNPMQWLINDGCTCPAGYGVVSDKTAPPTLDCAQCLAGEYSPGTSHLSIGGCSPCYAGTYNTTTGNSSCGNCTVGYYCTGGSNRTYCGTGFSSPPGSSSYSQCYWVGT